LAAASLAVSLSAAAFAAGAPGAAAEKRAAVTDAEIIGAVTTGNQGEIDAAALAASRTKNAGVKAFAARMLKDHGRAKEELAAVEKKSGIKGAKSGLREALKKDGAELEAKLTPLSGDAFDRAYMDAEVADHAALLKKLDSELIPDAKNRSLGAFLRRFRTVVAHHLALARKAQAEVERTEK
ncbi:MAG TPA: DUF4142 domain-containing protein, partial [Elusimicrobiota bacterium]|nr:DUF4142 domain-containing protein [Elusimicrobiota bacterium]